MKFRLSLVIVTALAVSVPLAFGQAQPPVPPQTPPAAAPEVAPPKRPVPPGYKYEPRGRRDPFVNPVPKRDPEAERISFIPSDRPPGLKGLLISEVVITAVVVSAEKAMNVALVQGPGNRTYRAFPGDEVLDGVVSEIRKDSVVFTVRPLPGAPPNPEAPREVVVKIRSTGR